MLCFEINFSNSNNFFLCLLFIVYIKTLYVLLMINFISSSVFYKMFFATRTLINFLSPVFSVTPGPVCGAP